MTVTKTTSAIKHSDGTMTTSEYGTAYTGYGENADGKNDTVKGGVKVVAVTWKDYVEYVSSSFEGPPGMTRSYEFVMHSYVGKTVATFAKEERIMSDVWDMVSYVTVMTDDGEFETSAGSGTVDASPEDMAAFKRDTEFKAVKAKVKAARDAAKRDAADAAAEAATPYKGKTVTFVKGRKVPKGTTGEVIWYGAGKKYGYYGATPMRVGVKDAAGTVHWSAASNVKVVDATASKAA